MIINGTSTTKFMDLQDGDYKPLGGFDDHEDYAFIIKKDPEQYDFKGGNDTAIIANDVDDKTLNLGDGDDFGWVKGGDSNEINGDLGNDVFYLTESTYVDENGNQHIYTPTNTVINGGDGDDLLWIKQGTNTQFFGGDGHDVVILEDNRGNWKREDNDNEKVTYTHKTNGTSVTVDESVEAVLFNSTPKTYYEDPKTGEELKYSERVKSDKVLDGSKKAFSNLSLFTDHIEQIRFLQSENSGNNGVTEKNLKDITSRGGLFFLDNARHYAYDNEHDYAIYKDGFKKTGQIPDLVIVKKDSDPEMIPNSGANDYKTYKNRNGDYIFHTTEGNFYRINEDGTLTPYTHKPQRNASAF